jgi:hypothetical protein
MNVYIHEKRRIYDHSHANFFFLEYTRELCIIALRRERSWNTAHTKEKKLRTASDLLSLKKPQQYFWKIQDHFFLSLTAYKNTSLK